MRAGVEDRHVRDVLPDAGQCQGGAYTQQHQCRGDQDDEAGEFAYLVGLPGKSGVGGGIAAINPRDYAVAVWSPRLNSKGNSIMGMKIP